MIRDALKVSRDRKGDSDLEVIAMDNTGEPVRQGFETMEGIEMVPGTVHLVDSEFNILRRGLQSLQQIRQLFFTQC
jgi:hypothetical protein